MDSFDTGVHLDLKVGASFYLQIMWEDDAGNPVDLSGYTTARMQLRKTVDAIDPPIADLSTESGTMVIDGYNGGVVVSIPSTITQYFTGSVDGVWDLFLFGSAGEAFSDLQGTFHIEKRVTQ